jgi:hypothetical protein
MNYLKLYLGIRNRRKAFHKNTFLRASFLNNDMYEIIVFKLKNLRVIVSQRFVFYSFVFDVNF